MILHDQERETIINLINIVVKKLYKDDIELVQRGGMERSIQFRFGLYFYELIKEIDSLSTLDIDLEYNKNGVNPKRTRRKPNGVRPDLILHRRGINDINILVVEFKGWWNFEARENDVIKLEDFVHQDGDYRYGLGALIELNKNEAQIQYF